MFQLLVACTWLVSSGAPPSAGGPRETDSAAPKAEPAAADPSGPPAALDDPAGDPTQQEAARQPGGLRLPRRIGAVPIVLVGVGVVQIGAGVVLAVVAKQHHDNAGNPTFDGRQVEIERGRTSQTLANTALGVGATSIAVGVALWIFSSDSDEPLPVAVSPDVAAGRLGVLLTFMMR